MIQTVSVVSTDDSILDVTENGLIWHSLKKGYSLWESRIRVSWLSMCCWLPSKTGIPIPWLSRHWQWMATVWARSFY